MLLHHYATVSHHCNSFCIKEADELNYITLTLTNITLRRKYGRLFFSYATKPRNGIVGPLCFFSLRYLTDFAKRSKGKLCMMKKAETQRCVETENSAS